MAFSYEFGADSALLDEAASTYAGIATKFNTDYINAKSDLEALKKQLEANGVTQAEWSAKLDKVLNYLELMDSALKSNTTNLKAISAHVTDMANKMQNSVAAM